MENSQKEQNFRDFVSKFTKYLMKEKNSIKFYDENLGNLLNNSHFQIIIFNNEDLVINDFLKLFFVCINVQNILKEKNNFLRYSYKIFTYLNTTKLKIHFQLDKGLNYYTESYVSSLTNHLSSDQEIKISDKIQKYYLSYIEFIMKFIVSNFNLKFIFYLVNALFELNNICKEIKLRDKCKHLILRICDNIDFKIFKKIDDFLIINKFDKDKYIKDWIKYFNEEYDICFYSFEFLKTKEILETLVDNICLYEKKCINPLKNFNLNQVFNAIIPIKTVPDLDKIDQYKNFKHVKCHNEKSIVSGRFGWCHFCRKTADFYCIVSRLAICSVTCKNNLLMKEKFAFYREILLNYNLVIFKEYHEDIEDFINGLCTKLIEEDYIANSQNSFKLKFEIILKFFKNLSYCISNELFLKIKKNLIKMIGKFIYFGDVVIQTISINILVEIKKKFGNLIKNEIKYLILDIFIKILESCNEFNRVHPVIWFLNQLFNINHLENFLLFQSNFDLHLYQPDLNKILIESLFKILKDDKKDKQIKNKVIILICRILHSLFKFSLYNCTLISHSLFHINQNERPQLKDSLYICKDKFNNKPKDIVTQIDEKLEQIKFINFDSSKNISNEEKRNFTIVHILRNCHGIDKEKIGDWLSEPKDLSKVLLEKFMNTFNFQNTHIIEAMRKLLFCIKLPGEAQKIDRFMESFAKKYYADNSTKWENSDPLYYLCFSIIMLQTDIHNPNVKKKMSVQDYIKNLEKQNNGKNFDSLLLEDIYDTLKKKPFLFFNYDNSTMTQNDDISIKNFYMNIDLSEKEDWNLNFRKNDIFFISKMFFQSFFLDLEVIFYNNLEMGIDFYKSLINTLLNFMELLNLLHMKNEAISLVHYIIKILTKNNNLNIKNIHSNMVTFILQLIDCIIKKPNLFLGTWINTIKLFFYYYNNLCKLYSDKISLTDEESKSILNSLSEIFKREKIENYLMFGIKFNNENYIEFLNGFFFNLKNHFHENLNKTNLLMILVMKKLIMNFSKNSDVWANLINKVKDLVESVFKEKIEKEDYNCIYDLVKIIIYLFMDETKLLKNDLSLNLNNFANLLFTIVNNNFIIINDKCLLLNEFNNYLKSNNFSSVYLKVTKIIMIISQNIKVEMKDNLFNKIIDILLTIIKENLNEKILYTKDLFKIFLKIFEIDFNNYQTIINQILNSNLSFSQEYEEKFIIHFKKLIIKKKVYDEITKKNYFTIMTDYLNLVKFLSLKHVNNNNTLVSSRLISFLELIFEITDLEKANKTSFAISMDLIDNYIHIVENLDKNIIEISCNKILKVFYKLIDINSKSLEICRKMLTFLINIINKHLSNSSEQIENIYEILKLLNCFFTEDFRSKDNKSIENILSIKTLDSNFNFHYLIKHLLIHLRENIIYIIHNYNNNIYFKLEFDVVFRTSVLLKDLVKSHYNINFNILKKILASNKNNKISEILFQNSANIYFQRLILTNYYAFFTYMIIKENNNSEIKEDLIKLFLEIFEDLQQNFTFVKTLYFENKSILEFYKFIAMTFLFFVKFDKNNKIFDKRMKLSILEYLLLDDNELRLNLKNILYELISNEV